MSVNSFYIPVSSRILKDYTAITLILEHSTPAKMYASLLFTVFHFIAGDSRTTFPGGISGVPRMCRPHLGFGHLILSTDNRLPALICNKGNQSGTIKPGWFPFIICALLVFFMWCFRINAAYGILLTYCSLNAYQVPLCIHQMCISYLLLQNGTLLLFPLCRLPLSYRKRTFSCSGCSAPAYQPTA